MSEFKIGDRIKIKERRDMAIEYGADADGTIRVPFGFTTGMQMLCGEYFVIGTIGSSGGHRLYRLEGRYESFSEEMFVCKVEKLKRKDRLLEFNEELL